MLKSVVQAKPRLSQVNIGAGKKGRKRKENGFKEGKNTSSLSSFLFLVSSCLWSRSRDAGRDGPDAVGVYHPAPPCLLLDGELVLLLTAVDAWSQPSAISAASSLALLRFLPSYQNRAATVWPLMVTRDDQAVRPPVAGEQGVPVSKETKNVK